MIGVSRRHELQNFRTQLPPARLSVALAQLVEDLSRTGLAEPSSQIVQLTKPANAGLGILDAQRQQLPRIATLLSAAAEHCETLRAGLAQQPPSAAAGLQGVAAKNGLSSRVSRELIQEKLEPGAFRSAAPLWLD